MKKLIFITALAFVSSMVKAQNDEAIALSVWIPEETNLSATATRILDNKLHQIVTNNNIVTRQGSPFVITANVVTLSKEVVPSVPPKHAYELDITLYIGNGKEGQVFSSYNIKSKAVGSSEEKAYMYAFRNVNEANPKLQQFLTEGKNKILAYYKTKCPSILEEAKMLTKTGKYQEALAILTDIPKEVKSCYDNSLKILEEVYTKKVNAECKDLLRKAQMAWAASPNSEGAYTAVEFLSEIDPQANCYSEVKQFITSMGNKMNEVDKREWQLKVDKEVGLEKDRIQAAREMAKAYYQNQPKTVVYKSMW